MTEWTAGQWIGLFGLIMFSGVLILSLVAGHKSDKQ